MFRRLICGLALALITSIANAAQPVTLTDQTGNYVNSFSLTGTLPAFASTPTFNIGTAPTIAVTGTFFQATQPISAASLPLPTGAFQAGGAIGNFPTTVDTNAGAAGANTVRVVIGTGGATPLPTGAATSANQPTAATQGSTTSGQTGFMAMGAVTTGSPSYTTAQTSPFSLDTAGNLRVNVVAGGAGGGAVTVADGADVTLGAKADAATCATTNTAMACFRQLHTDMTSAIPAGSAIIGKVGIDQTTPGTTNAVAATNFPTTADTNAGAAGASTLRVVIATGGAGAAAQTSGGAGQLTTGCTGQIKATATACGSAAAHQVYVYDFGNAQNAAISYIQVFDVAVGSVTLGTTVPKWSFELPASGGRVVPIAIGDAFANQITLACTTTATGNTAPSSNCSYNIIAK